MEIILLDENRFDNFAINHPNYNYYQTSNYGRLMSSHGYNTYYLGLVDDIGEIKAASLIAVKNEKNNKRKMGYAPRGFLIDWNDEELVSLFTEKIKEFLSKRSFTYLKVDPYVVYKERDLDGNEKMSGESNISFVSRLQNLGYIHMGYNNGMEASNPRWNATTILSQNNVALFNSISKEAREKINEAVKFGNKVYKGNINDISLLHNLMSNIPIELLSDYYQFYGANGGCEIYFSKLEPVSYVNSSKMLYEKEEQKNNELNMQMQDWNNPYKESIISLKLKSDELLAKYKKNMLDAINLFQKYPSGIITAGVLVIKYGKKIIFVACGVNENFKEQYPDYLLKWQLMQEFGRKGYVMVDFNGITKDFSDPNNIAKVQLSNRIVEYVGEFDLVINKKAYYTGSKLNPILNWLNTPL